MHNLNRQLRYTRQQQLCWTEVEPPSVTDRSSAVVRPLVIARSDADALVFCPASTNSSSTFRVPNPVDAIKSGLGNLSKKMPLPGRYASAGVGQQGIAEVVEIGPDVSGLEIGQLVVLSAQTDSDAAIVGDLHRLDSNHGWLSDQVLVPNASSTLIALPESLDPLQLAAVGGDLLSAWNAVEPQLVRHSDIRVLVIGGSARCAALYSVALANSLGAGRIDYTDTSAERVAIAERLGANATVIDYRQRKAKLPPQYNLVVCGSTERNIAAVALTQLLPGGVFVQLPPFKLAGVRIPLALLYDSRLAVAMSAKPSSLRLKALLAHMLKHPLNLNVIMTHRADFDQAPQHLLKDTTGVVLHRPPRYSRRTLNPSVA